MLLSSPPEGGHEWEGERDCLGWIFHPRWEEQTEAETKTEVIPRIDLQEEPAPFGGIRSYKERALTWEGSREPRIPPCILVYHLEEQAAGAPRPLELPHSLL